MGVRCRERRIEEHVQKQGVKGNLNSYTDKQFWRAGVLVEEGVQNEAG